MVAWWPSSSKSMKCLKKQNKNQIDFAFNDLPSDVKVTFTTNPFIVEVDVVSYLRQNLGDLPIAERKLNPQVPVVRAFMHFP